MGQIRLDQNTNDFATLDVELCKNYLLLVGNDEGLPVKIRYYVPNFLDVPQQLKDHVTMLSRQGLDIDWVSEIGFVKNW